jgi:hypothetical protein
VISPSLLSAIAYVAMGFALPALAAKIRRKEERQ